VLDNGSTDGSFDVVEQLATEHPGRVLPWGVERGPFRRSLRAVMYDELRLELGPDDWFLQLDADEFLMEDPRPKLAEAGRQGYDRVSTWQAQFQFTEADLRDWEAGRDDGSRPVCERRRWFKVDWREGRFFRNRADRRWEGETQTLPDWAQRTARWHPVNRHYQYRDPEQIQRRLDVRAAVRSEHAFSHVTATDWRSHVVPTRGLRRWSLGEPLRPWPWRYYVEQARRRVTAAVDAAR
jgi:hypothetical protein